MINEHHWESTRICLQDMVNKHQTTTDATLTKHHLGLLIGE